MLIQVNDRHGRILSTMNDFIDWINAELNKRDWTNSRLAERAGVTGAAISHLLNRKNNPSFDICVGIAHAFDEQPEHILRLAGLLPSIPEDVQREKNLLYAFRKLKPDLRDLAIASLRGMAGIQPAPVGSVPTTTGDEQTGDERAPELEQTFDTFLQDLFDPDRPHKDVYDTLWDVARTDQQKIMLARLLAAAADKYERGDDDADAAADTLR